MREIAHLASGPGEAVMVLGRRLTAMGSLRPGRCGTRSRAMAWSISSTHAAIVSRRFPAP